MPAPLLSLGYPRLWRPNTVPTFPIEVDWTHPLARTLLACYTPGVTLNDLTTQCPPLTTAGSPPVVTTARGPGVQLTTSTGSLVGPSGSGSGTLQGKVAAAPGSTLFWAGTILGNATSTQNPPFIGFVSSGNNSPYVAVCIASSNSGNVAYLEWNAGGTFNFSGPLGSAAVASATLAATFDYSGGNPCVLYQNGGSVGLAGFGGSRPNAVSDGVLYMGAVPFNGGAPNNITNLGLVYGSALSAGMIAWLNAEPFAMLRPVVRRSFFVGSGVAPTSAPNAIGFGVGGGASFIG